MPKTLSVTTSPDAATLVTLTALVRVDTGLPFPYTLNGSPITLPRNFTDTGGVWTLAFDEPEPGQLYDVTYTAYFGTGGTAPSFTRTYRTAGVADPATAWGSWAGMKSIGGAIDAAIASNLDNLSTAADLARVQDDLADATAEAQAWAEGNGYDVAEVTALMASAPNAGRRIRRAVNTLGFAYLIQHRQWFDVSTFATDTQKALAGMESRAEKMLTELFGSKPQGLGIDKTGTDQPDAGQLSFVPVTRDGEDTTVGDEFSSW